MGLRDAPQVGDDAGIRSLLSRVSALESQLRMVSAAASGNQSQLDFLSGQTVSAESNPWALAQIDIDPATSDIATTWLPFDSAADAEIWITPTASGILAVQAGGYIGLYSNGYPTVRGFIGVEVRDEFGGWIADPLVGDGNYTTCWGVNNYITNASVGYLHRWGFTAGQKLNMRCRRGFSIGAGTGGATARVEFQGTSIVATKIGM